jgi:hypothetical protein
MPDDATASLTVHELGTLRVPSGKLGASDPFVDLGDPVIVSVPPGDYPVKVTVADVSGEQDGSHLREAYLSVVLSPAESTSVVPATAIEGASPAGQFYGVGVDSGTVGFADAEAVKASMPEDGASWYEDVFDTGKPDSWFAVMDAATPHIAGCANLVMPRATAGENVVLAHSGWGDGFYPLLETRGIDGTLTGIHIDLRVVGLFDDEEVEPPHAQKRGTWLSRLFKK